MLFDAHSSTVVAHQICSLSASYIQATFLAHLSCPTLPSISTYSYCTYPSMSTLLCLLLPSMQQCLLHYMGMATSLPLMYVLFCYLILSNGARVSHCNIGMLFKFI